MMLLTDLFMYGGGGRLTIQIQAGLLTEQCGTVTITGNERTAAIAITAQVMCAELQIEPG